MQTELWYIGKNKFKFVKEGMEEYAKRIARFTPFELIEIPKNKVSKSLSPQQVKSQEAISILKRLKQNDYLILLDEHGKAMSSKGFAHLIETHQVSRTSRLIFLIGGAYGFDSSVYQRGNFKLSLSTMTFSHQLAKLIFLEQFYRAMTILHHHPYHNE